ncbi:unnamed protein product [Arctogadus glacialis]
MVGTLSVASQKLNNSQQPGPEKKKKKNCVKPWEGTPDRRCNKVSDYIHRQQPITCEKGLAHLRPFQCCVDERQGEAVGFGKELRGATGAETVASSSTAPEQHHPDNTNMGPRITPPAADTSAGRRVYLNLSAGGPPGPHVASSGGPPKLV